MVAKRTTVAVLTYAAPLHSCRYRWLRAPATNITDSSQRRAVPSAGCCQHFPKIPHHLKQARLNGLSTGN